MTCEECLTSGDDDFSMLFIGKKIQFFHRQLIAVDKRNLKNSKKNLTAVWLIMTCEECLTSGDDDFSMFSLELNYKSTFANDIS